VTPFAKRCKLEALVTEREGMLAENHHRLQCGNSIAYGDEAFDDLAARMRALAETDAKHLPDWAKPLMRHVRNFCATHHHQGVALAPDLLRILNAWDALTDEQRNEVQP